MEYLERIRTGAGVNGAPGELRLCAAGGGCSKDAISAAAPLCGTRLYAETRKRQMRQGGSQSRDPASAAAAYESQP